MGITNFSAQEPSLGYYYQIRYSLYLLLSIKDKTNPCIKLENLDDIVVEDINTTDLYQTKLHINSIANLTDSSPDFWKTIRIWSENILEGLVDIDNTIFTLITTAQIGNGSFIERLRFKSQRDSNFVLEQMNQIIKTTSNDVNLKAFNSFERLTTLQQQKLIENIFILDSALSIDDALNSVKKELCYSAPPKHIDSFVERLEGWWFQQCINLLLHRRDFISGKELTQKIFDIIDTFQIDNLPDDFADPTTLDEDELPDYEDKIFVRQLKLVAVRKNVLRIAINDFRRAYEQRSKWLREDLTSIGEVDLFENRLHDHWNNIFSAMKDDCEGLPTEELERIGNKFYQKYYVERVPPIKIRERFQSEYLTRGSCHMLADVKKIGWHPNYKPLLD
jgi:hypothetical protein